jgi:hypothetical protein
VCGIRRFVKATESNAMVAEQLMKALASELIPSQDNIVPLARRTPQPAAPKERGTASDLASQAADAIRSIEAHATAVEARALRLAEDAVEKTKIAESRIDISEAARRKAELAADEANRRAQEAGKALKYAQSVADGLRAALHTMELRVKAAEDRANQLDQKLMGLEDAMQAQLSDLWKIGYKRNRTAA